MKKMRILLANKFYYDRGGDCSVTINLENLLKSRGHEVAVFSMIYPENLPSEWSRCWPKNMSKIDALVRPFGSKKVRRGFAQLLDDFRPDVVHLNNIHTQLSPVIAKIAHERGIRVVWTLHDTKLVCPCYTCMRDGHWCEDCMMNKTAVIKHRCMPGGVIGSTIGYLEAKKWNKDKLQEYTDLFLPPSQFMLDTVVRGGYDPKKFRVLCNFIDVEKVKNPSFDKKNYYLYDDYHSNFICSHGLESRDLSYKTAHSHSGTGSIVLHLKYERGNRSQDRTCHDRGKPYYRLLYDISYLYHAGPESLC